MLKFIMKIKIIPNETDHVRHNYFSTHENDYILLYIKKVQDYKQMKRKVYSVNNALALINLKYN